MKCIYPDTESLFLKTYVLQNQNAQMKYKMVEQDGGGEKYKKLKIKIVTNTYLAL